MKVRRPKQKLGTNIKGRDSQTIESGWCNKVQNKEEDMIIDKGLAPVSIFRSTLEAIAALQLPVELLKALVRLHHSSFLC